jgi:hypothetical protein
MKNHLQIIKESLQNLLFETKSKVLDDLLADVLAGRKKPTLADHKNALEAHLTKLYGPHDPDQSVFPEGHPAIPIYGKYDPRYNPYKSPAAAARGKEEGAKMTAGMHSLAMGEAQRAHDEAIAKGIPAEHALKIKDAVYAKAWDYWSK